MFDRILFPTDGGEPASRVLEYVLDAAAAHDATVHVLSVVEPLPNASPEADDGRHDVAHGIVEAAAERARERGIDVGTIVDEGSVTESIVTNAHDLDAGLLVVPTYGQEGIERTLLGSVTERVVTSAPCPVITVNPRENAGQTYPPRAILAPTDGSLHGNRAVAVAARLAAATGGTLHLLHVVETARLGLDADAAIDDDERAELREGGDRILSTASERAATAAGVDATTTVSVGRPHREIRSYVDEQGIDLVTLGLQGTTDFSRSMLGGVSSKLLRTSPVPLLTVLDGDEPTENA